MPDTEPDFLTEQQRQAHELAYQQGETNFAYPFEPWVVRGWAEASRAHGWDRVAEEYRACLLDGIAIANDPALSTADRVRKQTKNSEYGSMRNK